MLVLLAGVPLFLCMPPWPDITLYDVAARNVLRGGIHYRDVFDTNLPGIVWLMAGIRSSFVWSYEVLRAFDLLIVGGACVIAAVLARRSGATPWSVAWFAAGVALLYPFTSEFSHCQRDPWMFLPAAGAALLRLRRIDRPVIAVRSSILEGLLWGCAVWIKPHVLPVAAGVWLVSAVQVRHTAGWRAVRGDALGLLAGGLAVGAGGIAWLVSSGTWPHFWDVFTNWNPEYVSRVWDELGQRLGEVFIYYRPWGLVIAPATLVAIAGVWEALSGRSPSRAPRWLYLPAASPAERHARGVLGSLYLGWFAQALVLQRGFDYVHIPEALLALALLASQRWAVGFVYLLWFTLAAGILLIADHSPPVARAVERVNELNAVTKLERHPLADPAIVSLWPRCWAEGSSPELRDRIGHYTDVHCATNWEELSDVAAYLRSLDAPPRDRELTCWHDGTHPLYLMLGLEPSTRYMHFGTVMEIHGKVPQIRREVAASPQRYVVSDLRRMAGLQHDASAPGGRGPLSLPRWFPLSQRGYFPWNQEIVFRSGRYVVHKIVRPVRQEDIVLPDWNRLPELGPGE